MVAAETISSLPLTTIKFHQLQLFKGTEMANEFIQFPTDFQLFELDEYIDFITEFVGQLTPSIVIERFAGEVPPRYLESAPWGKLRYDAVLQLIEQKLEKRNIFQGKFFRTSI